jgi:two-component system, chemotaxis family, chemotaxis protein CheY
VALPRIVIVDDSPTIRRMVRMSLASTPNATFVEAGSGLEALEQISLGPVALMVLDLNMPDMHGLDVLKFLRSHSQYRALPVMVLTTRGDASSREEVLEAGATSYMTKPFSPTFLVSSVRELLDTAPDSSR